MTALQFGRPQRVPGGQEIHVEAPSRSVQYRLVRLDGSKAWTVRRTGDMAAVALNVPLAQAKVIAARDYEERLVAAVAEMGRGIEEAVCNTPSRPGQEQWLGMIHRAKRVYGDDFPKLAKVEGAHRPTVAPHHAGWEGNDGDQ